MKADQDLLAEDLAILRASNFYDALAAAQSVTFHDIDPFSDEDDCSLEMVVGRLARRAYCQLVGAGLVVADMLGSDPRRLGFGAPCPDDQHLRAYAVAVVTGNVRGRPTRPMRPIRRRPGARVR